MNLNAVFWVAQKVFFPVSAEEKIAKRSLMDGVSYLYPEEDKSRRFLGFSELIQLIRTKKQTFIPEVNSKGIVLDRAYRKEQIRLDYLGALGHKRKDLVFISKNDIRCYQSVLPFWESVQIYLFGFFIATKVVFIRDNRVNWTLLIRTILELSILKRLLSESERIEWHDFVQYDIDSNLIYLFLKEIQGENLTCFKYPSPGPLALHNSCLLTDVLVLNHGYHLDELKYFAESILCSEVVVRPPEGFFSYQAEYKDVEFCEDLLIGYYSHAAWLRKLEGHSDDGLDILAAEEKVLKMLANFIDENPSIKLVLFLHPREKAEKYMDKTNLYYQKYFGDNFEVASVNSSKGFNLVKLGIGVYSTILFERLVCGFPTLIFSPADTFPIKDSVLDEIILNTENFERLTTKYIKMESNKFFDQNGIVTMVDDRFRVRINHNPRTA